jgi:hypothetical protein
MARTSVYLKANNVPLPVYDAWEKEAAAAYEVNKDG